MGSFQTFPPISTIALTGDVTTAGSTATVVGLQTVPISSTLPTDQEVLTYVASLNAWVPQLLPVASTVLVNSFGVSVDYLFLVDAAFALGPPTLGLTVNGV